MSCLLLLVLIGLQHALELDAEVSHHCFANVNAHSRGAGHHSGDLADGVHVAILEAIHGKRRDWRLLLDDLLAHEDEGSFEHLGLVHSQDGVVALELGNKCLQCVKALVHAGPSLTLQKRLLHLQIVLGLRDEGGLVAVLLWSHFCCLCVPFVSQRTREDVYCLQDAARMMLNPIAVPAFIPEPRHSEGPGWRRTCYLRRL